MRDSGNIECARNAMKFTEKYEVLELLTSGRVSTFLARERVTRAQAVVHTFECPANLPVESRSSSILRHFASIAPIPTEPLIGVGFDEGSSSAYLVTRVPAPGALQSWVQAYRSFSGGAPSVRDRKELKPTDENATAELSASEMERVLKQSNRPKNPQNQAPAPPSPRVPREPFSATPSADSPQKRDAIKPLEGAGKFQRFPDRAAPGSPGPDNPFGAGPVDTLTDPLAKSRKAMPPVETRPAPKPDPPRPDLPKPDLSKPDPNKPDQSKPGSFTDEFLAVTDAHSDRTALGNTPGPERPETKEPGA